MKRSWLMALMLICLFLAGCRTAADTTRPPEIVYGEQVCEECGMIISEPRYAAAYYTRDGNARSFDDIGGMCSFHLEHQEGVASFWVHDFDTEAWLAADQATYVLSEALHTPMAFGVVAFADRDRAEILAAESGGQLMSFEAVLQHFANTGHAHDHQDEH